MKTISYALLFTLLLSATDLFAQLRQQLHELPETEERELMVRLTPEMFINISDLHFPTTFNSYSSNPEIDFLKTTTATTVFMIGTDFIYRKTGFENFTGNFPLTATEFNNQVRRQKFDPPPTSQSRNIRPLLRFN
ncbi:MAG: hypothetical protein JJU46_04685 [Balneolaceae bacterium]|nr:hypothetical protein [Balneolaceae bacterium]MCH8548518.1 hypothetical protein [Balneolaceae bacterium]